MDKMCRRSNNPERQERIISLKLRVNESFRRNWRAGEMELEQREGEQEKSREKKREPLNHHHHHNNKYCAEKASFSIVDGLCYVFIDYDYVYEFE